MEASNQEQSKPERRRRGSFRLRRFVSPSRFFGPRSRGLVRVAFYVIAVCFVIGILSVRSAMGNVSEQALVVGRQLSKLEDMTESSNRLLLNGQAINLASAVTTEPIIRVLDRFETICREEGVISHEFSKLDEVLRKKLPEPKASADFGILRHESDFDGVVACMVQDDAKHSVLSGIQKFSESMDLRELGFLRYAYARKTESGRTHVITAWTDGSFKLSAMLPPADGSDTPGSDPEGAPRPPESVRYLAASAEGAPHAIRVYESKASPKDVLGTYDREMPKRGWEPIKAAEYDVPEARYYTKDGVDLLVVADENGERTAVSMVETRSR